mgnify:CR=1 FL=1
MVFGTILKPKTWYRMSQENINSLPRKSGVYWLGKENKVIYIGSSENLHDRLRTHYQQPDSCIRQATQFAIETCTNYRERERTLLQAYLAKHGKLPLCNDRL